MKNLLVLIIPFLFFNCISDDDNDDSEVAQCVSPIITTENLLESFITTSNPLILTMDTSTHQFEFNLSENKTLCSIGYQGQDDQPYLIELIDSSNNIVFSYNMVFSTTNQDYIPVTPITLSANENYTIKRTKYLDIGYIIYDVTLPVTESFLTINSSEFYGDGGGAGLNNFGIPYITFGFSSE